MCLTCVLCKQRALKKQFAHTPSKRRRRRRRHRRRRHRRRCRRRRRRVTHSDRRASRRRVPLVRGGGAAAPTHKHTHVGVGLVRRRRRRRRSLAIRSAELPRPVGASQSCASTKRNSRQKNQTAIRTNEPTVNLERRAAANGHRASHCGFLVLISITLCADDDADDNDDDDGTQHYLSS